MHLPKEPLPLYVEYALDSIIPKTDIPEFIIHHESIDHNELNEFISSTGGKIVGELIRHNDGESIQQDQFE